ncbi:MAG: bifunctional tRNA (adenosine(37)-C2)-methyltransferase TrmG/ribosomal RNA large subunit methyltransferase RlmN, partial [Proteobacteria bacterium]|nr:bifunctional tRNA (adenosine(37)-C2)-methyltransferase TrmG/ribosomal RNA large subunit methyltransferase RlmN [Pseudomonadota bacterium]
MAQKLNLLGLDRNALQVYFLSIGEKAFHARQAMKWIYQRGVSDFSQMTDLRLELRNLLSQQAVIDMPKIANSQMSDDGTRKWLVKLIDGNCVETVFIPEEGRGTLCISSQVGCMLTCS